MRVVCESCGATYKIPEQKLNKDVNKATCRKCGHRMAIRRQAPGASGSLGGAAPREEATLITTTAELERQAALALGPSGQQPPAHSPALSWAPPPLAPAPPQEEHNPWGDEMPTQIQAPPPPEAPALSAFPSVLSTGRPAAVPFTPPAAPPPQVAPAPVAPPPVTLAPAPAPALAAAPSPSRTRPPSPIAAAAPAPAAPVESAAPRPQRPAHDPGGDLTWVLLGSFVAALGALVLALDSTCNDYLRFVGLFCALSGTLLGAFVLITGGRGRRKAAVAASVVFSGALALLGSAGMHFVHGFGPDRCAAPGLAAAPTASAGADYISSGKEPSIEDLLEDFDPEEVEAQPAAPPPPPPPAPTAEPAAAPPVVATAAPAKASEPRAAAPPPTTSSSRTTTTAAAAPVRGSGRDVVAETEPESAAPPKSTATRATTTTATRSEPASPPPATKSAGKATRIPSSVVETIVSNNKAVRRCFFDEKKRTGSLPSSVDVKFTVRSEGTVSSARVITPEYKGTDLDSCLSGAFRALQMPPFEGDDVTITYPFVL